MLQSYESKKKNMDDLFNTEFTGKSCCFFVVAYLRTFHRLGNIKFIYHIMKIACKKKLLIHFNFDIEVPENNWFLN